MGTPDCLRPRPVRRTGSPLYPTRIEVLSDPKLLEQHIPLSWLARKEVAAALSVLLAAGIAGCGPEVKVAPVSEHGEGRAYYGGIAGPSPYALMSEAEALSIIREELAAQGIHLYEPRRAIRGVEISKREIRRPGRSSFRRYFRDVPKSIVAEIPGTAKPYQADLVDPARSVAVEFIWTKDYGARGGPPSGGTGGAFDFREVAEYVSSKVREDAGEEVYFGAFYDPVPRYVQLDRKWQKDRKLMRMVYETGRERSRELLRGQVKDFAEWLKAQGVI